MFNGAYLDSVFGKYGSSLGPGYVFSNGIDYRFSFQVNTFDFVSMIFGCRVESNLDIKPVCNPFPCIEKLVASVFCFCIRSI